MARLKGFFGLNIQGSDAEALAARINVTFAAVDPALHATASWVKADDFRFATRLSFVPILLEEMFPVAGSLPIVFAGAEDGELALAVVSPGSTTKVRAVLDDGRWVAGYVPAILRLHPFACSLGEDNGVVFDPQSPCIDRAPRGTRFFDVTGAATPAFERVTDAVAKYRAGLERTKRAVSLLRRAGVMKPARALNCFDDPAFEDVLALDARKLSRIKALRLPPLFASGALGLAHAHLASLEQAPRLARIADMAQEAVSPAPAASGSGSDTAFLDMLAGAVSSAETGMEGTE